MDSRALRLDLSSLFWGKRLPSHFHSSENRGSEETLLNQIDAPLLLQCWNLKAQSSDTMGKGLDLEPPAPRFVAQGFEEISHALTLISFVKFEDG